MNLKRFVLLKKLNLDLNTAQLKRIIFEGIEEKNIKPIAIFEKCGIRLEISFVQFA